MRPFVLSALSLTCLGFVAATQPAAACMMAAPFQIEDIKAADLVLTGTLVRYERVSPGRPDSLDDYGLLTIKVDQVLKGSASGEVQLYWWNSTFGVPEKLAFGGPIIVAAVGADKPGLPLRGPSATVFATKRPDLPQIMQAPCSSAFLLPFTRKSADNIRAILAGRTMAPFNYLDPPTDEGTK
jgi:hypothetical protein